MTIVKILMKVINHHINLSSICVKVYSFHSCRHYMTLVGDEMDLVNYECLNLIVVFIV